uniref:Uncharacterized protein n=1 Tax=Rhizophora mucronata TaxID=61149 RepID=A0A2P2N0Q1_RHIMU
MLPQPHLKNLSHLILTKKDFPAYSFICISAHNWLAKPNSSIHILQTALPIHLSS